MATKSTNENNTLEQLSLCHDGRGHRAGFFVEMVVVTERSEDKSHIRHVFQCGPWLDSHNDNCHMETMLRMIGCSCTVTVKTSEGKRTATTGKVQITMYGTSGHTAALLLSSLEPGTLAFTSRAKSEFHISTGQVCRVTKIRLECDNSGSKPDWRLDYIKRASWRNTREREFKTKNTKGCAFKER
ncbi:LOXH1-like protein [Mya arenaria]|uniref:LOXH1-like protein n=1 Tax=Mya arenaria TaxID=6604 RepID=A0ABY7FAP1_MYAAR|nr:LOXH1-like protein [Mya arenaria]